MAELKMYFMGCSGIKNPVDMEGKSISVGDRLSWDYSDLGEDPVPWMLKPIFIVAEHKSGKGLCAIGIDKDLYLHDFRFQYCRIIRGQK